MWEVKRGKAAPCVLAGFWTSGIAVCTFSMLCLSTHVVVFTAAEASVVDLKGILPSITILVLVYKMNV